MAELHAQQILTGLADAGVDFVVVGGIAVVLHGHIRTTKDLDIVYATDDENLVGLGEFVTGLGARLRGVADDVPFVADARTLRRTQILTLDTHLGGLDLLVAPAGAADYRALRERSETAEIDGRAVRYAALPDLIAMKRAAGRLQDQADVEALEAIARLRR